LTLSNPYLLLLIVLISGFFISLILWEFIGPHLHGNAPGITLGAGTINKSLFYRNQKLNCISSIILGRFTTQSENELAIMSDNGASFVTYSGTEHSFISFERDGRKIIPLKVSDGSHYEFINRGGGWSNVFLLNAEGKTKWIYPNNAKDDAVDNMAAINREGTLEFVVGMNAGGGLRFLDTKGNLIRRYDAGNVSSVEVLDINNDNIPEILHSDSGNGIVIRRSNGDVIDVIKNTDGQFSVLPPSGLYNKPLLVYSDTNDNIYLIDLKGNNVKTFHSPGWGCHNPDGAVIYLNGPDNRPYFVFVQTMKATWNRSALIIFDSDGQPIYHEIIPTSQLAMAPIKIPGQDREKLLVGENSNVWEYSLR
jgi:hypothetical protein